MKTPELITNRAVYIYNPEEREGIKVMSVSLSLFIPREKDEEEEETRNKYTKREEKRQGLETQINGWRNREGERKRDYISVNYYSEVCDCDGELVKLK